MRPLSVILFSVALIACFSLNVPAQKKPGTFLPELSENATLEETQAWLVEAIDRNGSYLAKVTQSVKDPGKAASDQTAYADTKITDVKFQGSVITYRMDRTTQLGPGNSQTTTPPEREHLKVQFDLKDINPDEVTLQEIDPDSKTQAISLRTFNFKRAVSIKGSSETGNVTVSVVNIMVGKNIAEQVQAALIHAIKLCQAQSPKP
jgi:hypothetical protein